MSQVPELLTLGLWSAVWKLLRLRALITINGIRRASGRNKARLAILALFVVSILFAAYVASFALLRLLRSPRLAEIVPGAGSFVASMPVLVMETGFVIILMTSFGVLLQAMYLAGDMDFLLSAPIPVRAVFISKLLQAILPNLALFGLAAVPVLFGLGTAGGYNLLYYPATLLMLLALALAAAALASLLVMGVVRIFPARRAAEVLGFAGAIVTIICSQSGQFARAAGVSGDQLAAALRLVTRFDVPWSPLAWAGRGLVGIGEGRWLPGIGFGTLALGAAGLVFGVALTTAERLYYSGWAGMQVQHTRKRAAHAPRREATRPLAGFGGRFLPSAVGAIIAKDWAVLRRDLRHLSQLVTPLILGAVYALMLVRGGGAASSGQGNAPAWLMQAMQSALSYGSIAISLFVGWTLLSRLAAMGFSQEGRNYWLLKSAPVSANQLLASKFLAAYLPALALSGIFVIVLAAVQRAGLATLWFSLVVVALCQAAVAGLYLAFGVLGANMDWDDPRKMISSSAGCLGVLLTGTAAVVALALFALPSIGLSLLGWPALAGQSLGLALGGAFCLACVLLPLRYVRSRVARLGES